jgi:DNA invertase Pin-like site-specific DNA recombinase
MMEQHIGIYLRVSLEDFDLKKNIHKDESNSIFGQRTMVKKYILADDSLKNLPFTEFVDDGFTGTNFERPAFQRMLEQIKSGQISCVIVKDLSRFGRNYLEVGDYLEHLFPFLGIRFIAINDNYDSEDYAGTNVGIDIAFKNILHDYYSRDLSIKVRSAQRSRMKTGKYVNVPPYGYQRDPEDKHHLITDPKTAPVVRKIFEMIIAGNSTSEVAAYLNENHVPTPLQAKGVKRREGMLCEKPLMWSHNAVLNILGNYKYVGAMVNHTRENRKLRDKAQRPVPQEDWIVNEGMHEAIVSHEEFHKARQSLRNVRKYSRKTADMTNCVYYCGHCGRRLRKTYGLTTYLTCQTFKYIPDAECQSIRWTLPDIEQTVMEAFKVQLLFLNSMKKGKKQVKNDPGKDFIAEMARIKQQLEKCQNEKVQLYTEYRLGKLSKDGFIVKKAAMTKEADELTQLMQQTRDAYEQYLAEKSEEAERQAVIDQYAGYVGMSEEELVALMYQGIDRVLVFNDNHIEVIWKFQDIFEYYRNKKAG